MTQQQAEYLRFLCQEFGVPFQDTLTEGEADLLIESFLNEPMTESQRRTLESLSGQRPEPGEGPSYGVARAEIRRLVAIKAMRDLAGGAYSSSI